MSEDGLGLGLGSGLGFGSGLAPEGELDHKVAVGDAVDRVGARPREAEVGGEGLAVDAEGVAGEGVS